jgi:hypothetical protein
VVNIEGAGATDPVLDAASSGIDAQLRNKGLASPTIGHNFS